MIAAAVASLLMGKQRRRWALQTQHVDTKALLAEWIHFTLFGILHFKIPYRTESVHFWGAYELSN